MHWVCTKVIKFYYNNYYSNIMYDIINNINCSIITSNSSSKTRGAAAPRTRITCTSFLGLEEPSLKLLRSSELQRMNSSPISNCRRSKSAIFISRNINYNINSLLLLRVGIRIIYIYIYRTSVTYRKSK